MKCKILIALLLTGCAHSVYAGWRLDYSSGTQLAFPVGYKFSVKIPASGGHLNMITREDTFVGTPTKITMIFKVMSSGPIYRAVGGVCGLPPNFRFYVQRKGDNFSGAGDYQRYRYWSNPTCYVLGSNDNTTLTVTAQIKPEYWSDVYGQFGSSNSSAFYAAWKNADRVGITFGGCNHFGHGVYLSSGSSKLYLVRYYLN